MLVNLVAFKIVSKSGYLKNRDWKLEGLVVGIVKAPRRFTCYSIELWADDDVGYVLDGG